MQSITATPTSFLCLPLKTGFIVMGIWSWVQFVLGIVCMVYYPRQFDFFYHRFPRYDLGIWLFDLGIFGLVQGIAAVLWLPTLCNTSSTLNKAWALVFLGA